MKELSDKQLAKVLGRIKSLASLQVTMGKHGQHITINKTRCYRITYEQAEYLFLELP